MATPRADTYSAASGAAIYAGRAAPSSGLPAYMAGKPLQEWFSVAGTAILPASPGSYAFSGAWLKDGTGIAEMGSCAAGGHGDSYDNSVASINLMADAPAWTVRHTATPFGSVVQDVAYYSDGRPISRHTYYNQTYDPTLDRVLMIGAAGIYGNGFGSAKVDGFNLNTNKWDSAGPVDQPGVSGSGYADVGLGIVAMTNVVRSPDGNYWCPGNYFKWYRYVPSTGITTEVGSFGGEFRGGTCTWDPVRNQAVWWGQGNGTSMAYAYLIKSGGTVQTPLTFNASAAATAMAASGNSTDMAVYDPVADCFYWFNCSMGGVIFKITPNNGSAWDVSVLAQGGGSTPPPSTGFTYNRFRYVNSLNALFFFPANGGTGSSQNGYCMRLR